jgi:hypothetical protein
LLEIDQLRRMAGLLPLHSANALTEKAPGGLTQMLVEGVALRLLLEAVVPAALTAWTE